MRKYAGLSAVFILVIAFSVSCARAVENYGIAPDFKLEDLSQKPHSLSDYKGKRNVLLLFWTTWCPYCRKELKNLNGRYPELIKQGWEVLAVNVGESAPVVEKFVKNNNLTFKVLLDKYDDVAYSYKILGIPVYILINKSGDITFKDSYFPEFEISSNGR